MSRRTEVVVVGAGPIGLEAASVLKRAGIDYVQIDAGQVGETFMKWPRNTLFYSSPEWIAIAGIPIHSPEQFRITGERYLAYLRQVAEVLDLQVNCYERVTEIQGGRGDFSVVTERRGDAAVYHCAHIILATGGLDTPRMLGVPGEELPHVSHYFDEPHRYFRQRLLIVGGRNSAVEAAVRAWRAGAFVTISYRRGEIEEEKVLSRLHLEVSLLIEKGQIRFLPKTEPVRFTPRMAVLRKGKREAQDGDGKADAQEKEFEIAADFVYCATGFHQDPGLFRKAGIELSGDGQKPAYDLQTMETNVPGIYVAGTAAGGSQREFNEFITTGHVHSERILRALSGKGGAVTGNYPGRDYRLTPEDIE